MSVIEQLVQVKEKFIQEAPAEVQSAIFRHIQEQLRSGIEYGLQAGDKAPNLTLANPLGEPVNLYEELEKGPAVLTFYRGSWCPFCNIQLRAYQQVLAEIEELGGQLIAITPQSPDNSLSHAEKEGLTFNVLSDPDGRVSDSYKILYELPDYLQHTFASTLGLDLAVFNASERWVLPVPATFIIDSNGIIRRAHVEPDFMKRMEAQEIINELKAL